MSTAAVSCVRHLMDEYRRFLRTTYRLADPHLRQQFEEHIQNTDVIIKGPYVTLGRDFALGRRLAELVAEGIGHKDLLRLHWNFGDRPVYRHQEKALRRVDVLGRNCVVKTGTSSGKTEAFLLPVLSGVMRLRDQGVSGTKAILLYPMNALANDQLMRLRNLIRETGVSVSFAMYTGDSESVAPTIGEPVEGNELIKRDEIRRNPPDIILTNYKQLEFMLIRKADRPIFTPSLRYLVLDEIHSYRGALATEIACLVRRLKAMCRLSGGQLRCIGTSATVAEGAGGDEGLVKFMSAIFGETFEVEDVLGEEYAPRKPAATRYLPPFPVIQPDELNDFPLDDSTKVLELAVRLTGKNPPATGTLSQKIAAIFEGNELVEFLQERCEEPYSTTELAEQIAEKFPQSLAVGRDAIRTLVEAYLLVGSVGSEDDLPSLRPKLHNFFHGVYDVGLCMNPDCRTLVRDGSEECPKCKSAVRPAVLCRTCGQDFVKVKFGEDKKKPPVGNDEFASDEKTGFIAPRLHVEAEEDEDEEEGDDDANSSKRQSRTRQKVVEQSVCHACGMVHEREETRCQNPSCGRTDAIGPQLVLRGRGNTCPACNGVYTRGDILTLLRSGTASVTSLLATHHIDRLQGDDRKLLVFADNRQEAAHQAGYMADRHRLFAVRHAIESIVRERGKEGCSFIDLPQRLLSKFQDMGVAKRRLTGDEQKKWLKTLEFEAAGEFCWATHQRTSLENLALVEVQYEFLDELEQDKRFAQACRDASISVADGLVAVRGMLDRMRRAKAVDFDFYQAYLNPDGEPWSLLQEEPYCVSFPEHGRGPCFFMLDRAEAARHPVSGFRFMPLTKDTKQGASGAITKLLSRAGLAGHRLDSWVRTVVDLLRSEDYEILVTPSFLPSKVRSAIGGGRALQVSTRIMRLAQATKGYRCEKCQIWHPYRGPACFSSRCTGSIANLKAETADDDSYYVRFYRSQAGKRMLAAEHTAQISQEQRADLEKRFKEGRLDVLVCSPTLELGVDIGPLLTVLLRNAPPTPANYIQRAGRAGRRLRIGYVSTFCGMGSHDRHCFENPNWLVRGEFRPPTVRMDNSYILARHIRSFAVENLDKEFPSLMGDLLEDLDAPEKLDTTSLKPLFEELGVKQEHIISTAAPIFGCTSPERREFVASVVKGMSAETDRIVQNWHTRIRRIFDEWQFYRTITANRQARQKSAARERAYRELTQDQQAAYVLNYLSAEGFLPSYQFPTDTFNLEPGVRDTPTLRRPAWVALFEFAPGNLVYANSHKLKSIRAFFEGRNRGAISGTEGSLEGSGRVRSFCFCESCGFGAEEVFNECPECKTPMQPVTNIAFIESFEAEEFTQITSAEEGRERVYFERKEHLLTEGGDVVELFPYPFAQLEYCHHAKILITNWGKRHGFGARGEQFDLCPTCGKHKPGGLTPKKATKWDEDHAKRCAGHTQQYILGYEFNADALVMPISAALVPKGNEEAFAMTLGSVFVAGAVEVLEVEPDEIAFFKHPTGTGGYEIVFYETIPGGAGYLRSLAGQLQTWAEAAADRLFNHDCAKACYRCLKSYRNQPFHHLLDKELVRDALFQFSCGEMLGQPTAGHRRQGIKQVNEWIGANTPTSTKDTPIELKLLEAIRRNGRLPEPTKQKEIKKGDILLTVPDFAYEAERIAVYCDGFAYHGSKDVLASDSQKRNELQADGWAVLTFWGKTILKFPDRCEEQIWRIWSARHNPAL